MAALKSLASNPALTSPDSKTTMLAEVIGGIFRALEQYHGSDSVSVATLGGLAATSSLPGALRKSAARALANIHTQQSLPYLAGLLNEQDVGLVTAGLGGLSAFANNLAIGAHEPRDGRLDRRDDRSLGLRRASGVPEDGLLRGFLEGLVATEPERASPVRWALYSREGVQSRRHLRGTRTRRRSRPTPTSPPKGQHVLVGG